jgi:hypothetical protein
MAAQVILRRSVPRRPKARRLTRIDRFQRKRAAEIERGCAEIVRTFNVEKP